MSDVITGLISLVVVMLFALMLGVALQDKNVNGRARVILSLVLAIAFFACALLIYSQGYKLSRGITESIDTIKSSTYEISASYEQNDNIYVVLAGKDKTEFPMFKKLPKNITEIHYDSKANKLIISESEKIKKFDVYLAESSPLPPKKTETQ